MEEQFVVVYLAGFSSLTFPHHPHTRRKPSQPWKAGRRTHVTPATAAEDILCLPHTCLEIHTPTSRRPTLRTRVLSLMFKELAAARLRPTIGPHAYTTRVQHKKTRKLGHQDFHLVFLPLHLHMIVICKHNRCVV